MGEGTLPFPNTQEAQYCAPSSSYIDIEIGATQKESGILELADL